VKKDKLIDIYVIREYNIFLLLFILLIIESYYGFFFYELDSLNRCNIVISW